MNLSKLFNALSLITAIAIPPTTFLVEQNAVLANSESQCNVRHFEFLSSNQVLNSNDCVFSSLFYENVPGGYYYLIYQSDGNLVLYKEQSNGSQQAIWSSDTTNIPSSYCIMQGDGNLVIYNAANRAVWNSGSQGSPGSILVVQNDGNIVIYQPKWSTNTNNK